MQPLTMIDMHRTAEEHGLICLSTEYFNSWTVLLWQCKACGCVFPAKPNNIRSGKGCPICAGNRPLSLDDAKTIAQKRGGECLSTEYTNSKEQLRWRCANWHEWDACLDSIKNAKTWCGVCARQAAADNLRGNISEIQKICAERGGKCLSTEYRNSQTKVEVQCAYNHIFKKTPNKLKQGEWCPQCYGYIGEEICRWFLEKLFKEKFPKSRPAWLRVKGNQCELDGYTKRLGIAFEHHGHYHYSVDRCYSKTSLEVKKRQKRDMLKLQLCKQYNVKVIEIPELFQLTKLKNLAAVVNKECVKNNIVLPVDPFYFRGARKFHLSRWRKYGDRLFILLLEQTREQKLKKTFDSLNK